MNHKSIIILTCLFFVLIFSVSIYFLWSGNIFIEPTIDSNDVLQKKENDKTTNIKAESIEKNVSNPIINNEVGENIVAPAPSIQNVENIKKNTLPENLSKVQEPKEETLFQPVYGHLITRSKAMASFLLLDAAGKPLEKNIVQEVRLWRNYRNNIWFEDIASFNDKTSTVECFGFLNKGLEQSHYVLEVNGGGYGILNFDFDLSKDEIYQVTYKMPNFSKIITIHFIDNSGNDIEYIEKLPVYKWAPNKIPKPQYDEKKEMVLREAPEVKDGAAQYGVGGGGSFGPKENVKKIIYKTDNGKIYLRVFSGQMGEITHSYKSESGKAENFFYQNNFIDINSLEIPVLPFDTTNFNGTIVDINKTENGEKNGINSENSSKIFTKQKIVFDENKKGVSYHLKNSKFPLILQYKQDFIRQETILGDGFNFEANFDHGVSDDFIQVRLTDKKIFRTEWEEINLQKGMATNKQILLNPEIFITQFKLPPTLFEMAKKSAYIHFDLDEVDLDCFELQSDIENLYFTSFFIAGTPQLQNNLKNLRFGLHSNFGTTHKYSGLFIPQGFLRKIELGHYFKFELKFDANAIMKSMDKKILINLNQTPNILTLRAINYKTAGLPLVEASLIMSENLKNSLEIRNILEGLPRISIAKNISTIELLKAKKNENSTYLKLKEIFQKEELLYLFLNNGTWYNSWVRSVSDSAGYLILQTDQLIPGKKYSLFLWNQSSDDLKPDKEISFIAKDGITDLGAIQF